MKIIVNRFITFPGYAAINIFGVLFVHKGTIITDRTINHEKIHTAQMRECLYVFFYLWYLVEWMIRLCKEKNCHEAYRKISFEQEAYSNDQQLNFMEYRRWYAFLEYL